MRLTAIISAFLVAMVCAALGLILAACAHAQTVSWVMQHRAGPAISEGGVLEFFSGDMPYYDFDCGIPCTPQVWLFSEYGTGTGGGPPACNANLSLVYITMTGCLGEGPAKPEDRCRVVEDLGGGCWLIAPCQ